MQRFNLPTSDNGDRAQIFSLVDGQVNIDTGTITDVIGICCVADGALVVSFPSGDATIDMIAGDQFGFLKPVDCEVSSGKFHYLKAGS